MELYEKLAHDALLTALDRIPRLRREYRIHGDMDLLFPEASDLLQNLMMAIARLLGSQKCQDVELNYGVALVPLLSKNGLLNWYTLFRKDLETFDKGLETWAQFDKIFFVNRYFERLATHFSLVPEPTDKSEIFVHVPGQVDIDMLPIDKLPTPLQFE